MSTDKPCMASVVPEGEKGVARIKHLTITEKEAGFFNLRSAINGGRDGQIRPGRYAELSIRGGLMMTDTPQEWRTNIGFVTEAHGDVLIGGLGVGMVLKAILDKPEVRSVTVVEKYQDVIDLVEPHVRHPKLRVICADVFEWQPPVGQRWQTIYWDIWPDICTSNLDEIAKLKRRFAKRLDRDDPNAWHGAWMEGSLRLRKRREKACRW